MKTILKSTILFSLVLICLSACDGNKPTEKIPNDLKLGEPSDFEIEEAYADSAITNYYTYINDVKEELSVADSNKYPSSATNEKLNYGVWVDLQELKDVLEDAGPNAELYLMNGIMRNDSTETIFALKTTPRGGVSDVIMWEYFDFTQACPNNCPGFMDFSQ